MKNDTKGLRFAALIRVSTESQAKEGESLRTQRRDVEQAVRELGGRIVGWYGGQEHATPGFEKREVDRLLGDAQKSPLPFDAVVVTHADRWSRDNEKSKQGLGVLRARDVRFFINRTEHDLNNPTARFSLGMFTEIAEYQAAIQAEKSLLNRVARAERNGAPTSGKPPYGRMYDKEKEAWRLDLEKTREIREIARRYIAGEKMAKLAREFDFNTTHLHKVLSYRSGPEWVQQFRSELNKIDKTVVTKIPPLLDAATIKAVRARAEANKTVSHGKLRKQDYLLSHMVLCEHCGYAMYGHFTPQKRKVYRHSSEDHKHPCPAPHGRGWIDAEELEQKVLRALFDMFGNPKAVERAIEAATPNLERIKDAQKQIERLDILVAKHTPARERILRQLSGDTITEAHATKELTRIKQEEAAQLAEMQTLNDSISHLPSPDGIKAISRRVVDSFGRRFTSARLVAKIDIANSKFGTMTPAEERGLLEMVFGGKLPDGRRMGVYVEWLPGNRARHVKWRPILRGHLLNAEGHYIASNTVSAPTDEEPVESGGGYRQRELLSATRSLQS